jgi:hypothetical protein
MGRVASSVDNTMIESFWSTMQRELLDTRTWDTPAQLGSARLGDLRVDRGLVTTPADATPASATWPQQSSKPFPPPPLLRHDHHTTVSREPGQAPRCRDVHCHRVNQQLRRSARCAPV